MHGPEEFDRPDALALGEKIRRAAFTVAVSSFGRSQLCRWVDYGAWDRIHVVHCGIEPARFPKGEPLPTGGTHLVSIGRFVEQKGQLLLIDAIADAVADGTDLTLTLVGDGPMRRRDRGADLRTRPGFAGHHHRLGRRGAACANEIARAHALVMPSFAEGLPMVIMEAMAAGRPVVATYVAGIPELVRPGETGWLVPAGDVSALRDALREVAQTSRGTLAAMGATARALVLERHDVDREAARLALHLRRAAYGGRPEPVPRPATARAA